MIGWTRKGRMLSLSSFGHSRTVLSDEQYAIGVLVKVEASRKNIIGDNRCEMIQMVWEKFSEIWILTCREHASRCLNGSGVDKCEGGAPSRLQPSMNHENALYVGLIPTTQCKHKTSHVPIHRMSCSGYESCAHILSLIAHTHCRLIRRKGL